MKKYVEKLLLKMLLTEDEVLMGYRDTDQNVSAKSLTLLIFGWALCGRPQPEHESVMPLLSLSPLNVLTNLKLYPLSGNIFRKWFTSYFLFIHEHLIIM